MAEAVNLEARITLMDRFSNRMKKVGRSTDRFGDSVKDIANRAKESQVAVSVFQSAIAKFGGVIGRATVAVWRFGSYVKKVFGRIVNRAIEGLKQWMKRLFLFAKIALPVIISMWVHMSKEMERALRNVTSLMAGSGASQEAIEEQFRTFRRQLSHMSVKYGVDDVKLAEGLYNVVSATFEGPDAKKVLDVAAKGAAATLTPLNDMTGAVTKTLHAFRNEGESMSDVAAKAGYVMDQMFMTLNRGMFTMPEFVKAWEAIPSMLKAVGVSLEEGMAMYSTLSRRGLNVEEIETGIRALMLSFAKMEEGQQKAAAALFGDNWQEQWGVDALATKGLKGVMENLNDILPDISHAEWGMAEMLDAEHGVGAGAEYLTNKFGEMMGALTALFPNIRALKAVLALAGPGMEMFAEDLEMMGVNAVGATDRAFEEMSKSAEFQLDRLKRVWGELGQGFGDLLLPVLGTIGESVSDWYQGLAGVWGASTGLTEELFAQGLSADQVTEEVAKRWDQLNPFEQLFYMIKQGWTDFTDRVNAWLKHEGGHDLIVSWGVTLGKFLGDLFTGWSVGDINTGPLGPLVEAITAALKAAWDTFWDKIDWSSFSDAWQNPLVKVAAGIGAWEVGKRVGPALVKSGVAYGLWTAIQTALTGNTAAVGLNTSAIQANTAGRGMVGSTVGQTGGAAAASRTGGAAASRTGGAAAARAGGGVVAGQAVGGAAMAGGGAVARGGGAVAASNAKALRSSAGVKGGWLGGLAGGWFRGRGTGTPGQSAASAGASLGGGLATGLAGTRGVAAGGKGVVKGVQQVKAEGWKPTWKKVMDQIIEFNDRDLFKGDIDYRHLPKLQEWLKVRREQKAVSKAVTNEVRYSSRVFKWLFGGFQKKAVYRGSKFQYKINPDKVYSITGRATQFWYNKFTKGLEQTEYAPKLLQESWARHGVADIKNTVRNIMKSPGDPIKAKAKILAEEMVDMSDWSDAGKGARRALKHKFTELFIDALIKEVDFESIQPFQDYFREMFPTSKDFRRQAFSHKMGDSYRAVMRELGGLGKVARGTGKTLSLFTRGVERIVRGPFFQHGRSGSLLRKMVTKPLGLVAKGIVGVGAGGGYGVAKMVGLAGKGVMGGLRLAGLYDPLSWLMMAATVGDIQAEKKFKDVDYWLKPSKLPGLGAGWIKKFIDPMFQLFAFGTELTDEFQAYENELAAWRDAGFRGAKPERPEQFRTVGIFNIVEHFNTLLDKIGFGAPKGASSGFHRTQYELVSAAENWASNLFKGDSSFKQGARYFSEMMARNLTILGTNFIQNLTPFDIDSAGGVRRSVNNAVVGTAIGGTIGGILGTTLLPFVGTALGVKLGAMIGGYAGATRPEKGYEIANKAEKEWAQYVWDISDEGITDEVLPPTLYGAPGAAPSPIGVSYMVEPVVPSVEEVLKPPDIPQIGRTPKRGRPEFITGYGYAVDTEAVKKSLEGLESAIMAQEWASRFAGSEFASADEQLEALLLDARVQFERLKLGYSGDYWKRKGFSLKAVVETDPVLKEQYGDWLLRDRTEGLGPYESWATMLDQGEFAIPWSPIIEKDWERWKKDQAELEERLANTQVYGASLFGVGSSTTLGDISPRFGTSSAQQASLDEAERLQKQFADLGVETQILDVESLLASHGTTLNDLIREASVSMQVETWAKRAELGFEGRKPGLAVQRRVDQLRSQNAALRAQQEAFITEAFSEAGYTDIDPSVVRSMYAPQSLHSLANTIQYYEEVTKPMLEQDIARFNSLRDPETVSKLWGTGMMPWQSPETWALPSRGYLEPLSAAESLQHGDLAFLDAVGGLPDQDGFFYQGMQFTDDLWGKLSDAEQLGAAVEAGLVSATSLAQGVWDSAGEVSAQVLELGTQAVDAATAAATSAAQAAASAGTSVSGDVNIFITESIENAEEIMALFANMLADNAGNS